MTEAKPELHIIAGPNGAGKTTFVNKYLPEATTIREFVNADLIAKGISPFAPEQALGGASRVFLNRVDQLIEERQTFSFETTFSGRTHIDTIQKARNGGYYIRVNFIYLNSIELSLNRIAERVKRGGHNVPEDIIRRRYRRSIKNLMQLYLPQIDEWKIYDNSSNRFILVALGTKKERVIIVQDVYDQIQSIAAS
jgi:predicted ABC-type ATPase